MPGPAPAASAAIEQPASEPAASRRPVATLRGSVRPDGPPLTFEVFAGPDASAAAGPAGILNVEAIQIHRADGSLMQKIEGPHASTMWTNEVQGLELIDLDFDGFADLRLLQAPPAGPNTTYLHWLFDPAAQRFVANPALDELPGVQVNAAARELRSEWRDGPTRYGVDVFGWRDGKLVPLRRERRSYSRPGVFTLEVSRPDGAGWKLTEKRSGRDP